MTAFTYTVFVLSAFGAILNIWDCLKYKTIYGAGALAMTVQTVLCIWAGYLLWV